MCALWVQEISAQTDSTLKHGHHYITLSEVVVQKNLDVPSFIKRIQNDTSFYKAFRNLRLLNYTSLNDIRMLDKKGKLKAHLESRTTQNRNNGCRTMTVEEETVSGDIYKKDGTYNYYTLSMYASLFFTAGKICGEDNVVGDASFSVSGKKGMEKHKEQLKMLFFNPGSRIRGLPFMSNKTNMFSKRLADDYTMEVDYEWFNGYDCYVFKQKVIPGRESNVVIQEMVTWFRDTDMSIMGRNYTLKYDAGVYDFNVQMEVVMTPFQSWVVPNLIRYNGNWKVVSKKRERGIFTATLFNFSAE